LVGARGGSAIGIGKVHKKFGIEVDKEYNIIFGITPDMIPLELTVWNHNYGYHSVLAVDCEIKSEAVRITNFGRVTTSHGWIFFEELQYYIKKAVIKKGEWIGRRFRIKPT